MDKETVARKKSWWLVAITSVIALASIVSQIRYSNVSSGLIWIKITVKVRFERSYHIFPIYQISWPMMHI
jgi:hypothetical protein